MAKKSTRKTSSKKAVKQTARKGAVAPAKKAGARKAAKKAASPASKNAGGGGGALPCYTRAEAYRILREVVYPPCAKSPGSIRLPDNIETDLGYVGGSKAQLAPKTNGAFQFTAPDWFVTRDFNSISIVQEHLTAIISILTSTQRLDP